MALTNYGELKAAIPNWVHRGDIESLVPDFIILARSRIVHDLDSAHLDKRVSATLTSEYSALPTDLIELRSVKINNRRINFWTEDQIVQQGYNEATGHEAIYTIVANQIRVIGAPNNAELELVYKATPVAMALDADVDVILTNYPQLYLYAAILEYRLYAEDDIEAGKVAVFYSDAISQINDSADKIRFPNGQLQVRAL